MIDSVIAALQQPFFLRSLAVVLMLALVFPLYGNIVVVRQEANIAHTFAHMGLLGVAVGLRANISIDSMIVVSVLTTVGLLYILGIKDGKNHVAHNEISAQLGLVGAILVVSQMTGYKADISSYLFGDILLLGNQDLYMICGITVLTVLMYVGFGKCRYALSVHESLAISKRLPVRLGYIVYLIALGLLIGGAMKIIGVLLVSAFLVLPSNIGRMLARNKRARTIYGMSIGGVSSIFALFVSWHLDMPSGATIIACLLIVFCVVRVIRT